MPYSLGAVKPHVKAAAETLGPKYGFTVIYGWAPGLYDHPKGLALDFMTSDKAKGDALVADLMANASAYAVKYIVWYRKSWNPERGTWEPYTTTPNPHTDHVHVSFEDTPGSGVPTQNVGYPGQAQIEGLGELLNSVKWLTRKENWWRIGLFTTGYVLVLIGLYLLLGKGASNAVVNSAKKVVKYVK